MLIPKEGKSIVYSYGTNYEQTKAEAAGFEVELIKRTEKLSDKLNLQLDRSKARRLAADALSYESYRLLVSALRRKVRLKVRGDLVWELRKVKDEKELELMQKAGELTVAGVKAAYETIRPGLTEIEVAAEIEYEMRKRGGYGTAFDTIVASGVRSAYPHVGCTNIKIRKGDLVVVDVGSMYKHYRSDMTRTFAVGKPTEKQLRIYAVVKRAQEAAYQAIKPKAKAKNIDAAARKTIEAEGYGENFVHGLGHGIGLETHEPPSLGPNSKDKLAVGNVMTIEPGIYLPGYGGIRIEDTVIVQKRGAQKVTDGMYALQIHG